MYFRHIEEIYNWSLFIIFLHMTYSFQRKWVSMASLRRATTGNSSHGPIKPCPVGVLPRYPALSYKILNNWSKYSIMGKNGSACISGYFYPQIEFWVRVKIIGGWDGGRGGLAGVKCYGELVGDNREQLHKKNLISEHFYPIIQF